MAVAIIVLPVMLLSVMAARHIRHIAAAAGQREATALNQFARLAARELSHRLTQLEEDVIGFLDPATEESLTSSLELAELAFPGIGGFALMADGRVLYPRPDDGVPGETASRAAFVQAHRADVFAPLSADGLGHLFLTDAPSPWFATLHALRSGSTNGVVGIIWGAERLDNWCAEVARDMLPDGYILQLLGPGQQVLYPRGQSLAPVPEAGPAPLVADALLPAHSFPWTLRVAPHDPNQLPRLIHNQVMLQTAALAALCLLILAGLAMLVSVTLREVELGRMKADFAANVSHELRTPLSLIRAAAESLTTRPDLDAARQSKYLRILATETQRLSDLVDTVLRFSRIQRGTQRFTPVRADVGAAVQSFLARYRLYLDEQGFALQEHLPAEPLCAPLDIEGLHLVLANLIENAVKFSPQHKNITVSVERRGAEAAISVTDRGIGIAPDMHARIFESFYRVEAHATKETRGTGIGLALVKEIAAAHNGRVTVDSTPGAGATFTVWLPVADA
ncbi:MAG: HAMP domain-containing histidine kinase [Lentisphaerae bacterium]|nr:HAMP domain-containing histidine kinase [Lentisphaerota bacterium]